MNNKTTAENAGLETTNEHMASKAEVCEQCRNEQSVLIDEIDDQTLHSESPELRRQFLSAHLSKLGLKDVENIVGDIYSYENNRRIEDPNFDITKLPLKRLLRISEREQSVTENSTRTDNLETKYDNYQSRVEQLISEGKSNVEIINALVSDESVPESERAKLRSFQAIMDIAQAVPEDVQIIGTRLNTIDFSGGIPDPNGFATWAIFDSPKLSSGVSEATQNAVAAKLGINRHRHTFKTGGDVKDVFQKGHGTETYLDEDGEMQTRTVPLAPGKDVKIRDNQFLSVDNAGNKQIKINSAVGSYKVALPDNPTDEDMTQIVSSTQMIAVFHDLNLAEIMYGRPMTDRGGGTIELRFPADINRTKSQFKG